MTTRNLCTDVVDGDTNITIHPNTIGETTTRSDETGLRRVVKPKILILYAFLATTLMSVSAIVISIYEAKVAASSTFNSTELARWLHQFYSLLNKGELTIEDETFINLCKFSFLNWLMNLGFIRVFFFVDMLYHNAYA